MTLDTQYLFRKIGEATNVGEAVVVIIRSLADTVEGNRNDPVAEQGVADDLRAAAVAFGVAVQAIAPPPTPITET